MLYVYNKDICPDKSGCSCSKLHVIEKPNGVSVVLIQWHRGHKKCYFTLVPTKVFKAFKVWMLLNTDHIFVLHMNI